MGGKGDGEKAKPKRVKSGFELYMAEVYQPHKAKVEESVAKSLQKDRAYRKADKAAQEAMFKEKMPGYLEMRKELTEVWKEMAPEDQDKYAKQSNKLRKAEGMDPSSSPLSR